VANHTASITEPGVGRFDVLQNESKPEEFTLHEVYESEEGQPPAIRKRHTTRSGRCVWSPCWPSRAARPDSGLLLGRPKAALVLVAGERSVKVADEGPG